MNSSTKGIDSNSTAASVAAKKRGMSCACAPTCKCGSTCKCQPGAACTPACKCAA